MPRKHIEHDPDPRPRDRWGRFIAYDDSGIYDDDEDLEAVYDDDEYDDEDLEDDL